MISKKQISITLTCISIKTRLARSSTQTCVLHTNVSLRAAFFIAFTLCKISILITRYLCQPNCSKYSSPIQHQIIGSCVIFHTFKTRNWGCIKKQAVPKISINYKFFFLLTLTHSDLPSKVLAIVTHNIQTSIFCVHLDRTVRECCHTSVILI